MPLSGQLWEPGFLERSPLLRPFAELAAPLLAGAGWPSLDAYTQLVERERSTRAPELSPVRFAPPRPRQRRRHVKSRIDAGELYDGRIALSGEVPCVSESYHDFCNVLAWAAFPRAKRAVHGRQFRALQAWLTHGAERMPNRRTREQDALTLFDEGGSVLLFSRGAPPRVLLFGHALMEHVSFHPSTVRSAALIVDVCEAVGWCTELLDVVDRELERRVSDPREFLEPNFDRTLPIRAAGDAEV